MENWPGKKYSENSGGQNGHGETKPTKHHAYVVAIANQKGGVAKTTSVVSLGGALVRQGQEVLLVDLDAQANLTLALGMEPSKLRNAITDVFFDSASLLSVSRQTDIPGLDIIPSNKGMELAERFLPVRNNYETILQRTLRSQPEIKANPSSSSDAGFNPGEVASKNSTILDIYDFILIDCPPFMGAVTINALNAAELLVVPTQPEYFSVHALRTMLDTIRQVRSQNNPQLAYRVLITMYDQRNRIHKDVHAQIKETFSTGVFQTTISVDTKLRESAVEGLPITYYKSRSRSAQQYDALAQELIDYARRSESI